MNIYRLYRLSLFSCNILLCAAYTRYIVRTKQNKNCFEVVTIYEKLVILVFFFLFIFFFCFFLSFFFACVCMCFFFVFFISQ